MLHSIVVDRVNTLLNTLKFDISNGSSSVGGGGYSIGREGRGRRRCLPSSTSLERDPPPSIKKRSAVHSTLIWKIYITRDVASKKKQYMYYKYPFLLF